MSPKNKNYPALVADAQKRAQAFNAEERIAELEHIVESGTVGIRVLRAYARKHLLAAAERVAELEAENARLRAALEEIRDLDPDLDHRTFVSQSGRIALRALGSHAQGKRAKGWQLAQAKEILKLYQEGKMGLVTQADIDKIFADLPTNEKAEKKLKARKKP
jgi:hypothetical protein